MIGDLKLNDVPAVKVVSFDMDGTLTGGRFTDLVWSEGIPRLYSLRKKIPLEQAKKCVFEEYAKLGEGRREWYDIKYWFRLFDLGEDWSGLLKSLEHEIMTFPEVPAVLELLGKEHQLVVTSNASREFTDIELEACGVRAYFMSVFSATSDFGEVKKTPDVYLKVCQLLAVKPEQVAHVGDHYNFDFAVPRQLGIHAFYLDRQGKEQGNFVVHDLAEFSQRICSG